MIKNKPLFPLISTLTLLILLLIPSIVYAYDIEYFTYGGFVPMEQTLKRIALIFSDTSYKGLAFVVLVASILCSGAASFMKGAAGGKSGGPFAWFIPLIFGGIMYISFFTHTGTVNLYDAVLNKTAVISGIPDGITVLAGMTNKIKRGFIDLIDNAGGVNTPSYRTSGTGIGFDVSSRMANVSPASVAADETVANYTKDCVLFEIARSGTTLTPDQIYNSSSDFMTTLAAAQNEAVMTTSAIDATGNPISPGEVVSCKVAYDRLKPYYNNTTNLAPAFSSLCGQVGYDSGGVALCKDRISEVLQKEAGAGSCNIDADKFLSNYMIASAVNREISLSSGMANTVLNNSTAAKSSVSGWSNFTEWMPFMRAILLVIEISLIPILALFIASPFGKKAVAIIVGFFIFDMAWEITDALIYSVSTDYFTTYFQNCSNNQALSFYLQFPDASTKVLSALGTARMASFGFATLLSGLFMGATNSVLGSVAGSFRPYDGAIQHARGGMFSPGQKEEFSSGMAKTIATASNVNKFGFGGLVDSDRNRGAFDIGGAQGFGSGSQGQENASGYNKLNTQAVVASQRGAVQAAGGGASYLMQRAQIAHTGQQKDMGTVGDWQSYMKDAKQAGLTEDQAVAFGGMFMKGKDASSSLHATMDKNDGDLAKATGLNAEERKEYRAAAQEAMRTGDMSAINSNEKFHNAFHKLGGKDTPGQSLQNTASTMQNLGSHIANKDFKSISDNKPELAAMGALLNKDPSALKETDMAAAGKALQASQMQHERFAAVDKSVQAVQASSSTGKQDTRSTQAVKQELQSNLEKGDWDRIRKDSAQMAAMGALVGVSASQLTKDHMGAAKKELAASSDHLAKMEQVNNAIQSAPSGQQGQPSPKRDEKAVQADLQKNLQSGNLEAIKADPQQAAAMAALTGKSVGDLKQEDMSKAGEKLQSMSGSQKMQSKVSSAIQSAPSGQQGQPAPKRDEKAVQADLQKNLQSGNLEAIKADPQQAAAMAALTGKSVGDLNKGDMGKAGEKLQSMSGSQEMQSKISSAIQSAPSGQQGQPAPKRDEKAVQADLQKNLQSGNLEAIKADPQQAAAMAALTGKSVGDLNKGDMGKAGEKLQSMSGSQEMQSKISSAIQSAPSGQQGQPAPKRDEKAVQADLQKNLQSGNLEAIKADPQQAAAMAALTGKSVGDLKQEDMSKAGEKLQSMSGSQEMQSKVSSAIQSAPSGQQGQPAPKRDEKAVQADLQKNLQSGNLEAIKADPQQAAAMAALTGKSVGDLNKGDMGKAGEKLQSMSGSQEMQSKVSSAIQSTPSGQQGQPSPKRDEKAVQADLQKNLQSGNLEAIKADPQQAAAMAALTGKDAKSLNKDDISKANEELNAGASLDSKMKQADESIKEAQQQHSHPQKRDTQNVMDSLSENLQHQNFSAIKNDPQQLAAMGALLGKDPGKLTADDMPQANKAMIDMKDGQKQMDKAFDAVEKATPEQPLNSDQIKSNVQNTVGNLDKLESFDVGNRREMIVSADAQEKQKGLVGADAQREQFKATQEFLPGASTNDAMALASGKGVTASHEQAAISRTAGNKGVYEGFSYNNTSVKDGKVTAADVQGKVDGGNIGQLKENLIASGRKDLADGLHEGMMVQGRIDPHTGKGEWSAKQSTNVETSTSNVNFDSSKKGSQHDYVKLNTSTVGEKDWSGNSNIKESTDIKVSNHGLRRTDGDQDWSGNRTVRENTNIDVTDLGKRSKTGDYSESGGANLQHVNDDKVVGTQKEVINGKEQNVTGVWNYGKNVKTGERELVSSTVKSGQDGNVAMYVKGEDGAMHRAQVQGKFDTKGNMISGESSEITKTNFVEGIKDDGNNVKSQAVVSRTGVNGDQSIVVQSEAGTRTHLQSELTVGNKVESVETTAGAAARVEGFGDKGGELAVGDTVMAVASADRGLEVTSQKVSQVKNVIGTATDPLGNRAEMKQAKIRAADVAGQAKQRATEQSKTASSAKTTRTLQNQSKTSSLPKSGGPAPRRGPNMRPQSPRPSNPSYTSAKPSSN